MVSAKSRASKLELKAPTPVKAKTTTDATPNGIISKEGNPKTAHLINDSESEQDALVNAIIAFTFGQGTYANNEKPLVDLDARIQEAIEKR